MRWHKLLLVASTIAGCAVGPDYERPSAPAPAAYKEAGDWKPATPQDDLHRGAWWSVFNDPQLDTLEQQVNVSNQNLAQAEAQYRQALALVREARAGYFPTVSADASATRSKSGSGSQSSTGSSTSSGARNQYSLSLSASWELDLWGRVRRTVEANSASAQASAADLESTRLSLQSQLAQDYFALRIIDEQKRLLDKTVAGYETSLQVTKNRYNVGVAAKADVMQAETQLKTTQAQDIDLEAQRALLEHAIAVLVGTAPAEFSLAPDVVTMTLPAIPAALPSALLERRPDIAAAERRAAAANAQIGVAKAAYFPDLSLSASGGFQSTNFIHLLTLPNRFWSVGADLAETLFDAGARQAKTAQAVAAYDQSVGNYRQTVLAGFQEVEDNLAELRVLEREAQVQDEAVKAAEESLAITINQYKAGTVSYLNVVISQAAALGAERSALDLLHSRLTASVVLIKALGGGWSAGEPDAHH